MLTTWVVSLCKADVSIVDGVWGLGFVLASGAATWVATQGHPSPTQLLLPALVTLWGTRLSIYLTWRGWGEPEDYRYAAMRRRSPRWFPLRSLVVVFGLQAVVMAIVSLPLILAAAAPDPPLGWLDGVSLGVFLAGLAWEAVADQQLVRFKADPANAGRVLTTGLWRLSRHPNYFGEFLVWWGLFGVSVARGAPAWTVISPLLMAGLLLKVSGVPLLERRLAQRPDHAAYVARTPSFFPWGARPTS